MPTRPSPIDTADVLKRWNAGESAASIAADYGVEPATIRKVVQRHGASRYHQRSEEQREDVLRLHGLRRRQKDIAAETGLSRWAVRRILTNEAAVMGRAQGNGRTLVGEGRCISGVDATSAGGSSRDPFASVLGTRRGLNGRDEEERSNHDASAWLSAGFGPDEIEPWSKAGFPLNIARLYREPHPDGPESAHGYTLAGALMLRAGGVSAEEAMAWRDNFDGSAEDAVAWHTGGFGPDEAQHWTDEGIDSPEDANAWIAVGLPGWGAAGEWARKGITPEETRGWRAAGFTADEASREINGTD